MRVHFHCSLSRALSVQGLLLGLSQQPLRSTAHSRHAPEPGLRAGLGAQVNLHAMTAGVAMLSLYVWLMGLTQCLLARGAGSLPTRLAIVSDKGKSSKEAGNLVVKEAVAAMMAHWEAPFRCATWGTLGGPGAGFSPAACTCAACTPPQRGCWACTAAGVLGRKVCCSTVHTGPSWLLDKAQHPRRQVKPAVGPWPDVLL